MQYTRAALSAASNTADAGAAEAVYQAVCRDIIEAVSCTRASIWRFVAGGAAIRCACLHDLRGTQFPTEMMLPRNGMPLYFELMRNDRLLVIPDYAQHPATRNLGAPYAQSSGIRALIDVLISDSDGEPLAIVSAEQDRPRDWREADILFMFQIADLATPLIRRFGRPES